VQEAAQIGAGVGLTNVGPEGEGKPVAFERFVQVQEQIGQQRHRPRLDGEAKRLLLIEKAQLAKQVESQHADSLPQNF
jgi:hypothetical protein